MKIQFSERIMARLRYVFGLGSPLLLGEGERMEVRGWSYNRDYASGTLTLPSPLRRERRKNVTWKTRAAVSLIMGLLSALSMYAQENPEIARRAMPVTAGPNDVARFLAGMPVPENSSLAPLTRDPAWQEHAAFFEKEFSKLTLRQLQKLHTWQETHFPESLQPIPVAFYMFSGPDFLYVDQFFPKASVYVLCGKESMGPPPDPLRIANLAGALGNARADKSITNVTFGSLNGSGAFQESAPGKKGGSIPGVRINYTDNQSGSSQTLYYFTTDISDGGTKATPGFLKFCQRLGPGSSFLKSSSYLMFEEGFATIRNFILEHSNRVVQDDSGIPLAYFDPNKWSLRLFGTYPGPIELFKQHFQPKLQELFAQGNSPPLEFGFGYRWNPKEANLMVEERK